MVSLEEFIAHRKAASFEQAMVQMAADPAIRRANTGLPALIRSLPVNRMADLDEALRRVLNV